MSERIKTIIIDDDLIARERLKDIIESSFPELIVLAEATSSEEGEQAIKIHEPDLLFLDIELETGNGFHLLNELSNRNYEIVIITAHEEYALQAIKASALDYLIKPISAESVREAIKKYRSETTKKTSRNAPKPIDGFGVNIQDIKQIALPTLDGYTIIETKDILYAEADGSYTSFHLINNKKFTVSRNLKEYDDLLNQSGFFRIHHSFLVNLNYVRKYTRGKSSCVELIDGTELEVAVRRRDSFLKTLSSI